MLSRKLLSLDGMLTSSGWVSHVSCLKYRVGFFSRPKHWVLQSHSNVRKLKTYFPHFTVSVEVSKLHNFGNM